MKTAGYISQLFSFYLNMFGYTDITIQKHAYLPPLSLSALPSSVTLFSTLD